MPPRYPFVVISLAREGGGAGRRRELEAKKNKTTAKQSPLLMLPTKSPFPKDVYAPAVGLCKDSIIMQSRKPSNSDFWRSFNM